MRALAPSLFFVGIGSFACAAIVVDVSADGESDGSGESGESGGSGGADKGEPCDLDGDCAVGFSCEPVAGGEAEYVCAETVCGGGSVSGATAARCGPRSECWTQAASAGSRSRSSAS